MDDVSKKTALVMPWWVKVLLCAIPAFFSYLTAKYEAKQKAKSLVESSARAVGNRAEAGYDELVRAVQHIDDEVDICRRDVYELRGHVAALETYVLRMRSGPGRYRPPDDAATSTSTAPPAPRPLDVAQDLDSAVQKHGKGR